MFRIQHKRCVSGPFDQAIPRRLMVCVWSPLRRPTGFSRSHVRDGFDHPSGHGQVPEEVSKPYQRAGQFVQVRTKKPCGCCSHFMSFYVIFIKMGWNIGTTQAIWEAPKIVVLLQKIDHCKASNQVPRSWQWRQLCLSKNPFKQLHINFTFFFIPDAGNWINQPATLCNTDKKA